MSKETIQLALATATAPPIPPTPYGREWFAVSDELAALAAMLRRRFPDPFGEATRGQIDALRDLRQRLRDLRS